LIDLDFNPSHDFVLSKTREEASVLSLSLNSFNVLNQLNDVTYMGALSSPFFILPPAHATRCDVQVLKLSPANPPN